MPPADDQQNGNLFDAPANDVQPAVSVGQAATPVSPAPVNGSTMPTPNTSQFPMSPTVVAPTGLPDDETSVSVPTSLPGFGTPPEVPPTPVDTSVGLVPDTSSPTPASNVPDLSGIAPTAPSADDQDQVPVDPASFPQQ